MGPKKPVDPPLVIPPLPSQYWRSADLEEATLDLANPKVVQFTGKPNGKYPGDYLALCALLQYPAHPSVPRANTQPLEMEEKVREQAVLRARTHTYQPTSAPMFGAFHR
jgi:hypothetical protein